MNKYDKFVKAIDEFEQEFPEVKPHHEWIESIKDMPSKKYGSTGMHVMDAARKCDIDDLLFYYSIWDFHNPFNILQGYNNKQKTEQAHKIKELFREAVAEVLKKECGCRDILSPETAQAMNTVMTDRLAHGGP